MTMTMKCMCCGKPMTQEDIERYYDNDGLDYCKICRLVLGINYEE